MVHANVVSLFFFFNDTATPEIYTLSLHDALPISSGRRSAPVSSAASWPRCTSCRTRSEEHTSELQSQSNLVCRLLLEKKKKPPPSPLRRCLSQQITAPVSALSSALRLHMAASMHT